MIKLAYVSQYDATNIHSWSGLGYHIAQCLRDAGFDVSLVGPLKNQYHPVNIARYLTHKYLFKKNDHPQRDPGFLKHFSRQAEHMLQSRSVDLVFAPGSLPLCYLQTALPVVLWTDCTFANLLDYYPKFSNLSARSIRDGHDAERRALTRCDLILFSSQWAADSAIHDYGIDPAKIRLIPFGSNMPGERPPDFIERVIALRLTTLRRKVTLVLIGVDWYRKGADIASGVVATLVARGIEAELTVVGCSPSDGVAPPHVRFAGFIDKSKPEGLEELARLLETSHFLILPSRAECFGVVFCEAASYGLPSLASQTGGIESIITDGINGQTFPSTATPDTWTDRIVEMVCEPDHYAALCRSSFQAYRERLNWATSGQLVKHLLEDLLQKSA